MASFSPVTSFSCFFLLEVYHVSFALIFGYARIIDSNNSTFSDAKDGILFQNVTIILCYVWKYLFTLWILDHLRFCKNVNCVTRVFLAISSKRNQFN